MTCDEITSARNSVSTNVTNTALTNVTSSVSINSDDKKVRFKGIDSSSSRFYKWPYYYL